MSTTITITMHERRFFERIYQVVEQVLGDVGDLPDGLAHSRPRLLPVAATEAIERRALATGVAADGADLVGGDVELV